jgi:hypothetical protein
MIAQPYDAISAWGTLGAAIATAIAVIVALRSWRTTSEHGRLALSSQLLLNLTDKYNEEEMRQKRVAAAKFLLHNQKRVGDPDELTSTVYVLNYFESIASFVRLGAIDKEAVWQRFYVSMYMYLYFSEIHIRSYVESNPMFWRDVRKLVQDYHKLDEEMHRQEGMTSYRRLDKDGLEAYLKTEAEYAESGG